MKTRRTSLKRLTAALLVPAFIAAGCANNDDSSEAADNGDLRGKVVKIFGPEVGVEAQGFLDAFKPFEDRTGIDVQYEGDRSFEEQIGVRVSGNNAPDIGMFPQPGKVKDFATDLQDLPDSVTDVVSDNFDAGWTDLVEVDDNLKAIPAKADLKSLVWYNPAAFEESGYEVPTTWADYNTLIDKVQSDGKNAFCVGLGSDAATGWPFTDWMEDYVLRLQGPEVYDQWVNHEIPFNDPKIVSTAQEIIDLWNEPNGIYGGTQNAAATPFADAGLPLLDKNCYMYRMGNFYAANFPEGTTFGEDGQINAFYLPGSEENPNITLTAGIYAAAFQDRPEVVATMEYIASTEYADSRAPQNGYLSPNKNVDVSLYPDELSRTFGTILSEADPSRFDASDQMPGAVGAGSFWTAGVQMTTGAQTPEVALKQVEDSWPS